MGDENMYVRVDCHCALKGFRRPRESLLPAQVPAPSPGAPPVQQAKGHIALETQVAPDIIVEDGGVWRDQGVEQGVGADRLPLRAGIGELDRAIVQADYPAWFMQHFLGEDLDRQLAAEALDHIDRYAGEARYPGVEGFGLIAVGIAQ